MSRMPEPGQIYYVAVASCLEFGFSKVRDATVDLPCQMLRAVHDNCTPRSTCALQ